MGGTNGFAKSRSLSCLIRYERTYLKARMHAHPDAGNPESYELSKIIGTPYPNVLLEAKFTMGETEGRIVDLIVRRTLGYATGQGLRRAHVRLSYAEIKRKIGRSSSASISNAVETLVRQGFIEVLGKTGDLLTTAQSRRQERSPLTFRIARRFVERT